MQAFATYKRSNCFFDSDIAKGFEISCQFFILQKLTFVTMKQIIILISVIAAIVLITLGVDNISEPSNVDVAIGVFEVILGIAIIYKPVTSLFKKL